MESVAPAGDPRCGRPGRDRRGARPRRHRHRATAGRVRRAARPTEQAKEGAWAQVVETDELPNALVFAAVEGFAQPEQHELVRPYVGRYLDAVPRVWSERTSDIARTIITRLFPRILSDQTTADTVRAWLDHAEAPPTPSTRRRSRRSRPRATRPGLRSRGGDVRTPLTARRAVGSDDSPLSRRGWRALPGRPPRRIGATARDPRHPRPRTR